MGKDKQITQKDLDKLGKEIKDGVSKMVKDINNIHDGTKFDIYCQWRLWLYEDSIDMTNHKQSLLTTIQYG